MALQIAGLVIVATVEPLERATGLSNTPVVEKAIDRLAGQTAAAADSAERMSALLSQLDRVPDRPDAFDPLQWDARGLPG